MPLYDQMYLLSADDYFALTQTKGEHEKLVDTIRVNGGQINHIEIGEGGKVVIKPSDLTASSPTHAKVVEQRERKKTREETVSYPLAYDSSNGNGRERVNASREGKNDKNVLPPIEDVLEFPPIQRTFANSSQQTDSPKLSNQLTQVSPPTTETGTQMSASEKRDKAMQTIADKNRKSFSDAPFPSRSEVAEVGSQNIPLEKSAVSLSNSNRGDLAAPNPTLRDAFMQASPSNSGELVQPPQPSNEITIQPVPPSARAQSSIKRHSLDTTQEEEEKRMREFSPPPPAVQDLINERLEEINQTSPPSVNVNNSKDSQSDHEMENTNILRKRKKKNAASRVTKPLPSRKSLRIASLPPKTESVKAVLGKKNEKKSKNVRASNKSSSKLK